mgnify:CR=1 FL=1
MMWVSCCSSTAAASRALPSGCSSSAVQGPRCAYDSVYGARPIKRFIQSRVETLIAKAIIKGSYAEAIP